MAVYTIIHTYENDGIKHRDVFTTNKERSAKILVKILAGRPRESAYYIEE